MTIPKQWHEDIAEMHSKFGFPPLVEALSPEALKAYLKFRIDFLKEELDEMYEAYHVESGINPLKAADDTVDALIDLCVVAIGTLDTFNIDAQKAWDAVHKANMSKEVGTNAKRPNEFGLPDLVKPVGWTAPCHVDNLGLLSDIFLTDDALDASIKRISA